MPTSLIKIRALYTTFSQKGEEPFLSLEWRSIDTLFRIQYSSIKTKVGRLQVNF